MKSKIFLPFLNIIRRPTRSIALVTLSILLSFFILGGALVISGLQRGLNSLEERLGADIMVVPYEAATKSALDDIILQGNPGYFYMNTSAVDKVLSTEGIAEHSEQLYLASVSASCCSYKVQLIGFDPETDFTITPWVDKSKVRELSTMDVYVGSDINAFVGDTIKFYDEDVTVAGRLERTGTYLDTAVYGSGETVSGLIKAANELNIQGVGELDPNAKVSSILINVADGYTIEDVMNDINIHVNGVKAVRTQNMISDVTTKLTGVSDIASVLIIIVWLVIIAVMMLVFSMMSSERKKEFAVLRVLGLSRTGLAKVIFDETIIVSLLGGIIGSVLAVILSSLFTGMIESSLGLPYLMPDAGTLALVTVIAILATVVASALAATFSAIKISRVDAALILRGEN